jgi:hypothetical protein
MKKLGPKSVALFATLLGGGSSKSLTTLVVITVQEVAQMHSKTTRKCGIALHQNPENLGAMQYVHLCCIDICG